MAAKLDYELRRFEQRTLAATRTSWMRQAERHPEEVMRSEYDRILGWAEGHISYHPDGGSFAYGLFKDGVSHANAIIDVTYQRNLGKKWLKLMDIHLAPALDLSFYGESPNIQELGEIYTSAIVGTMKLTRVHPTKVTKLYGRSGTLLNFLKGLSVALRERGGLKGFKVGMEGRWLVLRAH